MQKHSYSSRMHLTPTVQGASLKLWGLFPVDAFFSYSKWKINAPKKIRFLMISLEKSNFTTTSSLLLEVALMISTTGEQSGTRWRRDSFWTDNHIRQWQD